MECPNCKSHMIPQGGCWICYECGWSACNLRSLCLDLKTLKLDVL